MALKITGWLTLALGFLLILPLFGITQFGSITHGIIGWTIALIVIILGAIKLAVLYNK